MWLVKIFILTVLINLSVGDDCGMVMVGRGLSIGGEYSDPGEWPWFAPLFVKPYGFICGSTIISKDFLLGAASCVRPKGFSRQFETANMYALLGAYALDDTNNPNAFKAEFSVIYLHPDWNTSVTSYDADIALFKMKKQIEFTVLIQPICLPSEDAVIFDVYGTVVGYGFSENSTIHENRPKHVKIKSVDNMDCLYTSSDLAKIGSKRMFCAGERGKNPCRGDSGGPFMVEEDDHWSINGIVSAAVSQECEKNNFVLYTQVPKFLEWIKETMEKGDDQQLDCQLAQYYNDRKMCYTESLKNFQPDSRASSISLHDSLNYFDIVWINIHYAEVHYLPDFSFANKKFPNFTKLSIYNSKLKELDRNKLSFLINLIELRVQGNEIKELPDQIFDDLINLQHLNFDRNQVKILPQRLLWKLPKLKTLSAHSNQIEAVPARFFEMNKQIEGVVLHSNRVVRIEIDLRSLPKLKGFNLMGNSCIKEEDHRFHKKSDGTPDIEGFQRIINEKCLF